MENYRVYLRMARLRYGIRLRVCAEGVIAPVALCQELQANKAIYQAFSALWVLFACLAAGECL